MQRFLTYHPWPGGSMERDAMLALVTARYEGWFGRKIRWVGYLGTRENGEGWCLFEAPSQRVLLELFRDEHIPYIAVTPVWQVGESDLALERESGSATA